MFYFFRYVFVLTFIIFLKGLLITIAELNEQFDFFINIVADIK